MSFAEYLRPPDVTPLMKNMTVEITHVESPTTFWFRTKDGLYPQVLQSIHEKMNINYKLSRETARLSKVSPGLPVAVLHNSEMKRGIVLAKCEQDFRMVKVFLVDFGLTCDFKVKNLRRLYKEFADLEMQAIYARFYGLEENPRKSDASQKISSFLMNNKNEYRAIFKSYKDCRKPVPVVLKACEPGIVINEMLVKRNLCLYSEEYATDLLKHKDLMKELKAKFLDNYKVYRMFHDKEQKLTAKLNKIKAQKVIIVNEVNRQGVEKIQSFKSVHKDDSGIGREDSEMCADSSCEIVDSTSEIVDSITDVGDPTSAIHDGTSEIGHGAVNTDDDFADDANADQVDVDAESVIVSEDSSAGSLDDDSDIFDDSICAIDDSTSDESIKSCCSYTILSPDSTYSSKEDLSAGEEETNFTKIQDKKSYDMLKILQQTISKQKNDQQNHYNQQHVLQKQLKRQLYVLKQQECIAEEGEEFELQEFEQNQSVDQDDLELEQLASNDDHEECHLKNRNVSEDQEECKQQLKVNDEDITKESVELGDHRNQDQQLQEHVKELQLQVDQLQQLLEHQNEEHKQLAEQLQYFFQQQDEGIQSKDGLDQEKIQELCTEHQGQLKELFQHEMDDIKSFLLHVQDTKTLLQKQCKEMIIEMKKAKEDQVLAMQHEKSGQQSGQHGKDSYFEDMKLQYEQFMKDQKADIQENKKLLQKLNEALKGQKLGMQQHASYLKQQKEEINQHKMAINQQKSALDQQKLSLLQHKTYIHQQSQAIQEQKSELQKNSQVCQQLKQVAQQEMTVMTQHKQLIAQQKEEMRNHAKLMHDQQTQIQRHYAAMNKQGEDMNKHCEAMNQQIKDINEHKRVVEQHSAHACQMHAHTSQMHAHTSQMHAQSSEMHAHMIAIKHQRNHIKQLKEAIDEMRAHMRQHKNDIIQQRQAMQWFRYGYYSGSGYQNSGVRALTYGYY